MIFPGTYRMLSPPEGFQWYKLFNNNKGVVLIVQRLKEEKNSPSGIWNSAVKSDPGMNNPNIFGNLIELNQIQIYG